MNSLSTVKPAPASDLQRILCIGGGPAGLYFALLMKKQDPRHDIVVVERNKPYDTFGWGVVFSDQTLGNLQAADPQTAPRSWRVQPLGRHRGQHPRPQVPFGRPRLLRHRPQAAAEHPAEALRGRWACSWCSRPTPPTTRRTRRRPHHRQRRPEQPHPHPLRRHLQARRRPAPVPLRLAGHAQAVRRLHLRLRGDRARLVPGPCLPVRRHHLHLHRRGAGGRVAQGRPGDDGEGGRHRLLRKLFARYAGRPQADVERRAPARLGAVDPLPARGVPGLGAPQRQRAGGADGRCRAHGALLHRLGHQAGAGRRDRAGRCIGRRRGPAARAGRLRGGAQRRGAEDPERGAQLHRVVRERFALRHPAAPQFAYSLLTRSQRISHENLRLRDKDYTSSSTRTGSPRAQACAAARSSNPCRRCSRPSPCAASR
jgi:hypothetical protein